MAFLFYIRHSLVLERLDLFDQAHRARGANAKFPSAKHAGELDSPKVKRACGPTALRNDTLLSVQSSLGGGE